MTKTRAVIVAFVVLVLAVVGIFVFDNIGRHGAAVSNAAGGSLVGVGTSGAGISTYSPQSGRVLKRLTAPNFGHFPFLSPNGSSVYFTTPTPGSSTCASNIEKKLIGGNISRIVKDQQINAFTMTPSRKWAVWLSSSAGCYGSPPYALHELDVKTGQTRVHSYRSFLFSMAATADGSELALAQETIGRVPVTQETTKIYLYAWASAAREASPTSVLPCPTGSPKCTETSPTFGQNGELFYVASIGLHGENCAVRGCMTQRFMLVRIHQHKAFTVASVIAPNYQTYLAVSPSGNQAVLSIGTRSYFWEAGHRLVRIATLYEESW